MKNPTFKIAAAAMMVAGAFATQTYAAGFQLSEQSAIQMGRAMAGAGVPWVTTFPPFTTTPPGHDAPLRHAHAGDGHLGCGRYVASKP